jgi:DNA-binding NarL/FixJ family response regulator
MDELWEVARIGVVEDFATTRRGLVTIINQAAGMSVVADSPTVPKLVDQGAPIDLALLDLRLSDDSTPRSNIELLRTLTPNILVFTSASEPYLIREALTSGVLGILRKSVDVDELIAAIRSAIDGQVVPTMEWATAIDSDPNLAAVDLSPRQRQILELYAAGEPASRVASITGLSAETVNSYVGRIKQKYSEAGRPAQTKTDLYKRALEDGWLPMPRRFRH